MEYHLKLQEKLLNLRLLLDIPAEVRYRLLGHQDRNYKKSLSKLGMGKDDR